MWQVTCLLRSPTLSQRHVLVWSYLRRSYIFQVSSTSVQGFLRPAGQNWATPILWLLAFTTACTTVQAVICIIRIYWSRRLFTWLSTRISYHCEINWNYNSCGSRALAARWAHTVENMNPKAEDSRLWGTSVYETKQSSPLTFCFKCLLLTTFRVLCTYLCMYDDDDDDRQHITPLLR